VGGEEKKKEYWFPLGERGKKNVHDRGNCQKGRGQCFVRSSAPIRKKGAVDLRRSVPLRDLEVKNPPDWEAKVLFVACRGRAGRSGNGRPLRRKKERGRGGGRSARWTSPPRARGGEPSNGVGKVREEGGIAGRSRRATISQGEGENPAALRKRKKKTRGKKGPSCYCGKRRPPQRRRRGKSGSGGGPVKSAPLRSKKGEAYFAFSALKGEDEGKEFSSFLSQ